MKMRIYFTKQAGQTEDTRKLMGNSCFDTKRNVKIFLEENEITKSSNYQEEKNNP